MQIKATMMSSLTPARMSIIKTFTNNKRCRGCGEKRILLHCWWECKLLHPLWNSMVGIYSDKTKIQKDTCNPYVHNSTILNSQDMEATWSICQQMNKEDAAHTYSGMLLRHKK